jgi:hypothetical protein
LKAEKLILIGGALLALAAPGGAAQAQAIGDSIVAGPVSTNFARDRNISVRQRPRAEYEALGVHLGGFMLYPRVLGTVEHDSNIYALAANKVDDTIFRVQPELALNSNWSRHALNLYARSTITRYNDFKTEDTDEWQAGANGRLDILRDTTLNAGAEFSRLTEPRTATSTQQDSVVPIQYNLDRFNAVFVKEFNRIRITARGDLSKYNYHDGRAASGAAVEQDDRDRDEWVGTLRTDYAISPDTAVFVQGAINKHDYKLHRPGLLTRDSDGIEVLAGANFELSNLIRGDVGVGYMKQSYDDPAFRDISGLGLRGQLEWFPTQLTTVSMTGSRQVLDSGLINTAGYISTNVAGQVDHELRRNVILTCQISYGDDDYRGLDRKDKHFRVGVSGTYLLNRNIGLTVGYSYYDQNSSGAARGPDYTVNKFGATVTLQY